MPADYSIRQLLVKYGPQTAIEAFSADFKSGEMIALLGPNGCGKSTLIKTIAGLLEATAGSVIYHGRPITGLSLHELAAERAYLAAVNETAGNFTVQEVVLMGRYGHGSFGFFSAAEQQCADRALKRMQAGDLATRPLNTLSSGERQRVAAARFFCQDSPLMLLDEPTNFLDPPHQHLLLQELQKSAQNGHTIIAAIHDLRLAKRYFQRFLLMQSGHLVADLDKQQLETSSELTTVFALPHDLLFT